MHRGSRAHIPTPTHLCEARSSLVPSLQRSASRTPRSEALEQRFGVTLPRRVIWVSHPIRFSQRCVPRRVRAITAARERQNRRALGIVRSIGPWQLCSADAPSGGCSSQSRGPNAPRHLSSTFSRFVRPSAAQRQYRPGQPRQRRRGTSNCQTVLAAPPNNCLQRTRFARR